MTKAEIIAELRRSAREDAHPWQEVSMRAFLATGNRWDFADFAGMDGYDFEQDGTFFLLVAHALEDE